MPTTPSQDQLKPLTGGWRFPITSISHLQKQLALSNTLGAKSGFVLLSFLLILRQLTQRKAMGMLETGILRKMLLPETDSSIAGKTCLPWTRKTQRTGMSTEPLLCVPLI